MWDHVVELVDTPHRGLRVERLPWAAKWQRVTHALFQAVATLPRRLDWASVAAHVHLNWKTVAAVVEGAVLWGLQHHPWHPMHRLGLDEVSRRKGPQVPTVVYDLERGRVVWVGRDRPRATMARFFAWLGQRRARAIQTVCCELWAVYIDAIRTHLPQATIVFDRFHLMQYLSRAVDAVQRETWRQIEGREKGEFKQTRFLWLSNPENLRREARTRLSVLLRLNSSIVKAYLLKEDLRRFWEYRSTAWAEARLRQWLWRARHSRLKPFQQLARMLRASRRGAGLDPHPGCQRGRGGDEQHDQGDQPSRLWLPDVLGVYREHLPLLCRPPATLTLLGKEPEIARCASRHVYQDHPLRADSLSRAVHNGSARST